MALEKITLESNKVKFSVPREVPIRVTRELTSISKLEKSELSDEEKTDKILESSEKLQEFLVKHNPKLSDHIDDLSVKALFELFGEWAKKVQPPLPEAS